MKVFACRNSHAFGENVAKFLGTKLGEVSLDIFSDGEMQPMYNESVRGAVVFIIQSTCPPADNLMELLLMLDAAKRASAHKVIAVLPYFGWARQDRKDRPRVSIGAKLVSDLLHTAGADRVMTCDLHADQIQGFFDFPVDHIYASTEFIPHIMNMNLSDLAVASPDIGGAKRANVYAKYLHCPVVICHKTRAKANVVDTMTAIGEVEGKNIIIVDDMVDTAGTLCKAANMLMDMGAKSVRACITHPLLSGAAYERIAQSRLTELIVSNTLSLNPDPTKDKSKITVVPMEQTFAKIIKNVYNYEPISPEMTF